MDAICPCCLELAKNITISPRRSSVSIYHSGGVIRCTMSLSEWKEHKTFKFMSPCPIMNMLINCPICTEPLLQAKALTISDGSAVYSFQHANRTVGKGRVINLCWCVRKEGTLTRFNEIKDVPELHEFSERHVHK